MLPAMTVPDRREGQAFRFLPESQPEKIVARVFRFQDPVPRKKQGGQNGFQSRAGSQDPGPDTVHGSVEIIQSQMDSVRSRPAADLLGQRSDRIVKDDDMIAVPADAPADMDQHVCMY